MLGCRSIWFFLVVFLFFLCLCVCGLLCWGWAFVLCIVLAFRIGIVGGRRIVVGLGGIFRLVCLLCFLFLGWLLCFVLLVVGLRFYCVCIVLCGGGRFLFVLGLRFSFLWFGFFLLFWRMGRLVGCCIVVVLFL